MRTSSLYFSGALAGALVVSVVFMAAGWLWPAMPSHAAEATPVATWTPTPAVQSYAVGDKVEGQPTVTPASEQEAKLWRIIEHLEGQLATAQARSMVEVVASDQGPVASGQTAVAGGQTAVAGGQTAVAGGQLPVAGISTPVAPAIFVWEEAGSCWTPKDAQALHLCGADAGDGYVIRWVGVAGDSRGPEIPDADWLATQGGGDRLVWSGVHPGTGEAVTVNYWARGHTLAVHAAGRLLFRIDRGHRVW